MPATTNPEVLRAMMLFARDHQDQARAAYDQVREMLWNDVLDQIVDKWSVSAMRG